MEILNNLEWYFFYDEPKEAKNRDTGEKIKKIQLFLINQLKKMLNFVFH